MRTALALVAAARVTRPARDLPHRLCGLGLDIAKRVAESTGGGLKIGASGLGGAQVQMRLRTWALPPGVAPGRATGREVPPAPRTPRATGAGMAGVGSGEHQ